MFSRIKVGYSKVNPNSFPTVTKYVSRNKLVRRNVNTKTYSDVDGKKLGYVLVGGGCSLLGFWFLSKLDVYARFWQNFKPSSVLADVTPRSEFNSIANVLEDKCQGIVAIDSWLTEENNRKLFDFGVGFVDQSSELVITNESFVNFDQDKLFQVIFEDGSAHYARVVSLDNHSDLAALRICNDKGEARERGGIPGMKLCKSPLRLGERLVAITMHDKDSDPSVYKIYSGLYTNSWDSKDNVPLQMSTNVVDGAFGGPVLNAQGEVVGIVSPRDHSGVALSIPYSYVYKFIQRSLKHEKFVLEKEMNIRRERREEKEREDERQKKEMEEIIAARMKLEKE